MRPQTNMTTCNCVFCCKTSSVGDKLDNWSINTHTSDYRPFKQIKTFASRKQEVANIRSKFPNKIPVIVERYAKETNLPILDKTKFLVPQELTMSQFVTILRLFLLQEPDAASEYNDLLPAGE
nr:microtubule-associated proteins 1A/1B light chain 3C-like isoform X2 [Cherax quadricarinatus]